MVVRLQKRVSFRGIQREQAHNTQRTIKFLPLYEKVSSHDQRMILEGSYRPHVNLSLPLSVPVVRSITIMFSVKY
jgi:hypothetical protein